MRIFYRLCCNIRVIVIVVIIITFILYNNEFFGVKELYNYDNINVINSQKITLIAYSNKIIKESCYSIETAILAGHSYSLHTTYNVSTSNVNSSNLKLSPLVQKIFGYYDAIKNLQDDQLVLFADAFDVIFQ